MLNNVITNVMSKDCCGCGACYNSCPSGAISMQENEDGFLVPIIDNKKCTNCGLCLNACPSLNVQYKNNPKPECYAAMADDEIRMKSSSGGMFTLLAEHILNKGGYVCGAAFADDWSVHHIIIDNKEDLDKLRGSKYIQSDTEDCYKKIKWLLDNDKYVLFSGCPCQVAGLYSYLGNDYEKLYTVDLICHGAPSRKVWKKYLDENFSRDSITGINFRNKSIDGWRSSLTINLKDGTEFYELDEVNDFYKLFIPCICLMPHCSDCKFSKLNRQGDITLGDFWQIERFSQELNDGKGTSMLLVNNQKGEKAIKNIEPNLKLLKNIPLEFPLSTFNVAISKSWDGSPDRDYFFKYLNNRSIRRLTRECSENHFDCAINNLWWHANYGAIITSYALQETLEEMGYSTRVINYIPNWYKRDVFRGSISEKFANKYLKLSKECVKIIDLMNLNNCFDNFLVGSDQVFRYGAEILWNPYEWHDYKYIFYNSFVNFNKNKIACSASFGRSTYEGDEADKEKVKYYLRNFNHISVREDDGIDICKNEFGVNAEKILDPVFLVNFDKYTELIKNSKVNAAGKIAYYLITQSDEKDNILKYYSKKYDKDVYNTKLSETVEDWLAAISTCDLLITDSFHGICFAIIFNKPFIHIKHPDDKILPYSRFSSIFRMIKTEVKSVITCDDCIKLQPENLVFNWKNINEIIVSEIINSKMWLKNAIENKNNKTYSNTDVIINNLVIDDIHFKDEIGGLHWRISNEHSNIESVISDFENFKTGISNKLVLLSAKNKIFKSYYRYKVLSKILFGKKRKHYKEKAALYHEKVREIRSFGGGA